MAHVDHGKTTLVDAMLWQTGAFRANQEVATRVMDSNDLEREKGITILAKNTAVRYGDVTINILDTPGHADFGGEVERSLFMADGVALLVDASEGPLPQTRFVLSKALAHGLPVVLVVNKIDRPDARVAEVVDEVYSLFIELDADESQIEFPIVYCNAKAGQASRELDVARRGPDGIVRHAARVHSRARLRPRTSAAGPGDQPRRVAVCRTPGAVPRAPRHHHQGRADCLVPCRRHHRACPGDRALPDRGSRPCACRHRPDPANLIAVAGLPEVTIGDTLADIDDPRPLSVLSVDEPSMSVTIGTNTSPLAGRDGTKLTARHAAGPARAGARRQRVSLRVLPTDRPDTWEVQGRGELQLAVLVETMRREGFELTVGRPQVVIREIDGTRHEPVERVMIDVPEEHIGAITQLLAARKGRMQDVANHGHGWARMTYLVPTRGLIGMRTQLMTETRGTGIVHQIFEGWEPWQGDDQDPHQRQPGRRSRRRHDRRSR